MLEHHDQPTGPESGNVDGSDDSPPETVRPATPSIRDHSLASFMVRWDANLCLIAWPHSASQALQWPSDALPQLAITDQPWIVESDRANAQRHLMQLLSQTADHVQFFCQCQTSTGKSVLTRWVSVLTAEHTIQSVITVESSTPQSEDSRSTSARPQTPAGLTLLEQALASVATVVPNETAEQLFARLSRSISDVLKLEQVTVVRFEAIPGSHCGTAVVYNRTQDRNLLFTIDTTDEVWRTVQTGSAELILRRSADNDPVPLFCTTCAPRCEDCHQGLLPVLDTDSTVIGALVLQDQDASRIQENLALVSVFQHRLCLEMRRLVSEDRRVTSEAWLQLLTEQAPAILWTTDIQLRMNYITGTGLEAFHADQEELIGRTPIELLGDGENGQRALLYHQRALQGESGHYELPVFDHVLQVHVQPVHDRQGKIVGVVGVSLDVTQLVNAQKSIRQMEDELTHVARISVIAEMIGGIAHELNQPLYAMQNYSKACVNLIQNTPDFDQELVLQWLSQVGSAAEFAGSVISRLRQFVSRRPIQKQTADTQEIIDTALMLTDHRQARKRIEIDVDLQKDASTVFADPVQIKQVLVNLLRNAFDSLHSHAVESPKVKLLVDRLDSMVRFTVADNGQGFSGDENARFTAFQSTKTDGMGLGLPIARTIVEAHGGEIWAENIPDGGAAVTFTLPVSTSQEHSA